MTDSQKITGSLAALLLLASLFTPVLAQQNQPMLDRNLFSIGIGISDNEVSNPDEDDTGFQFFGAYDLTQINLMEGVDSSFEFGFMDFGFDDDDTGIWGSYVIDGNLSGRLGWLAQAGFDIGDDSGLLLGAGLKIMLNATSDLRFDYVVRDDVDSLQINFMLHL